MSLKGDVRRMKRDNVPRQAPNLKVRNVQEWHHGREFDQNEFIRAQQIALRMREKLLRDARNLNSEVISRRNNKIRMINQHLPTGSEIHEVPEVLGNFQKGGKVKQTGLYKLHKGEQVIPAKKASPAKKAESKTAKPKKK